MQICNPERLEVSVLHTASNQRGRSGRMVCTRWWLWLIVWRVQAAVKTWGTHQSANYVAIHCNPSSLIFCSGHTGEIITRVTGIKPLTNETALIYIRPKGQLLVCWSSIS